MNNEELMRLALDAALDLAVLAQDGNGKVTAWNVGAGHLLGYDTAEIIGQPADIIFTPEDQAAGVPEQERSQAREQGRAEDERWHMRKDGTRFWASGLMVPLPANVGYLKVMRDRTQKHLADKRIETSEARFRTLATNIPQLVFSSRGDGMRTWGSPQWVVFTGLSEAESVDYGWLDAVHESEREFTRTAWTDAQKTGEYYVEHRIQRARDGEFRWHQTRAVPLDQRVAEDTEWVGTSTDIHELRVLQDTQQVLLAELQHRTRNLLAMVQAIARRGARASGSVKEFLNEFESRLRALSRAESLLPIHERGTVDVQDLIHRELAAHVDVQATGGRVQLTGDAIGIPAGAAQMFALGLHELATNSVKYGALKHNEGGLHITWACIEGAAGPELDLTWRESGVVIADALPHRSGYGTELLTQALPFQLNARVKVEYTPQGMCCTIQLPLKCRSDP